MPLFIVYFVSIIYQRQEAHVEVNVKLYCTIYSKLIEMMDFFKSYLSFFLFQYKIVIYFVKVKWTNIVLSCNSIKFDRQLKSKCL